MYGSARFASRTRCSGRNQHGTCLNKFMCHISCIISTVSSKASVALHNTPPLQRKRNEASLKDRRTRITIAEELRQSDDGEGVSTKFTNVLNPNPPTHLAIYISTPRHKTLLPRPNPPPTFGGTSEGVEIQERKNSVAPAC